jgi:hypothetical protein
MELLERDLGLRFRHSLSDRPTSNQPESEWQGYELADGPSVAPAQAENALCLPTTK